ncbi:centromere protein T isoform X2 [Talpa occidentalis]|uniref:centromere protein T isoform X2 n=1 Tax=Talpa occidentalis TaxID=50954 RepID=UPI0018904C56|nr:centromere protein T isoform X2 [Talpa occidentalis]
MADSYGSDSEPTTRTLLRHVLDTADPRTPRRRRSARARAHGAPPETPSFRRWSSQTKMTARQSSRRTRSTGRLTRTQASEHLEEQTPRTLLKNILLTAPESSIVIPEPKVKPVPAPQIVQPSRLESSRDSLELQLPELEPTTVLAPGLLAPGRKKQRLRLSVFQQGMDQEMPLSQEPRGNANASSLTSSLNLTFAIPLQPQSVQRPGLARRPLTRRAVDVGAFLQDLRDTSFALAPSGDSLRTPVAVAALPTDMVLEDTQPFSQPLVGLSPRVPHSLPCPSHMGAKDDEKPVSPGTSCSRPGLQNNTQLLAGKAEEADALAVNFPNTSSSVSDEDGVEPLQDGVASPELVSGIIPEFLQTRQCQLLEQAAPPSPAVSSSEPQKPLSAKLPPRARVPRIRKDPHKTGLSHYAKLFSFYAKMPMEKKAFEMVEKCLDKYFEHLCDDLEVFAAHAGRKTVRPEDLELLMRRQGLVTNQVSLHVLVERHLPLEYRQLLIPCAFSGNAVFPAQ